MASQYGPLQAGDTREDGYIFLYYRSRMTKTKGRVGYELWVSPEAFEKQREKNRKRGKKKYHAEHKYDPVFKKRQKEYSKKYCAENREKVAKRSREYYRKNKENIDQKRKEWLAQRPGYLKRIREAARAEGRDYCKIYYDKHKKDITKARRDRYNSDPIFKMLIVQRNRIKSFLKRKNTKMDNTSAQLIGCSPAELREHLEKQFKPGMTWENHGKGRGKWNVDHIIPLNHFYKKHDLTDPAIQHKAFHYTNLQPLWASENIAKSDKMNSN